MNQAKELKEALHAFSVGGREIINELSGEKQKFEKLVHEIGEEMKFEIRKIPEPFNFFNGKPPLFSCVFDESIITTVGRQRKGHVIQKQPAIQIV